MRPWPLLLLATISGATAGRNSGGSCVDEWGERKCMRKNQHGKCEKRKFRDEKCRATCNPECHGNAPAPNAPPRHPQRMSPPPPMMSPPPPPPAGQDHSSSPPPPPFHGVCPEHCRYYDGAIPEMAMTTGLCTKHEHGHGHECRPYVGQCPRNMQMCINSSPPSPPPGVLAPPPPSPPPPPRPVIHPSPPPPPEGQDVHTPPPPPPVRRSCPSHCTYQDGATGALRMVTGMCVRFEDSLHYCGPFTGQCARNYHWCIDDRPPSPPPSYVDGRMQPPPPPPLQQGPPPPRPTAPSVSSIHKSCPGHCTYVDGAVEAMRSTIGLCVRHVNGAHACSPRVSACPADLHACYDPPS